ncbi:MAG: hypothetical protein IPJ82_08085 [Lewinellaceae bacterium]|nr:hypothetical protein [Lewinellaceae bacterium]
MKTLLPLFLFFLTLSLSAQNNPEPPLTPSTFSVWSQRMDLSEYSGKKYRLTVAIRMGQGGPDAFAVAFIRNEIPEGGLRSWTFMDNMFDRAVRDSTWKTCTLEHTVDKDAPWLGFGVLGFSSGVFYYDDMHLSVETAPGKWKELPIKNGDFEAESLAPWQQTAQGVPARVLGAQATLSVQTPFADKQCLKIENKFLK